MARKDKSVFHILPANEPMVDIAKTVSSWLSYNTSVSGMIGVQENMIDYPIKSFLVCHQNEWLEATFEETHPYLKSRRIDFYYEDKKGTKYYVEFKQAKAETRDESEIQRIFNDLIRLSICKKKVNNDRCYFLMFGDVESYKKFFVNGGNSIMSFADYFCFNIGEEILEKQIFPTSAVLSKYDISSRNSLILEFSDKYKSRNEEESIIDLVPESIIVKLVWTNYESIENSSNIVGLWEIMLEPTGASSDTLISEMDLNSFIDTSTGI